MVDASNITLGDVRGSSDGIIVDFDDGLSDDWQRFFARCALEGIPVFDYGQVREGLTRKVKINSISENSLGTLFPNDVYRKFKRAFDSIFAILVIQALLPLLVVTAILIKLDIPGSILFKQKRIGAKGKPFFCYKFRTMQAEPTNRPQSAADHLEVAKTNREDTRITKLGGVLRKFRIDELSQLVHTLKGEMSWIEPRPEAQILSALYEEKLPFYYHRYVVQPGISGWAQVRQGHVTETENVNTKLQYDFYNSKSFSIWLYIIFLLLKIKSYLPELVPSRIIVSSYFWGVSARPEPTIYKTVLGQLVGACQTPQPIPKQWNDTKFALNDHSYRLDF